MCENLINIYHFFLAIADGTNVDSQLLSFSLHSSLFRIETFVLRYVQGGNVATIAYDLNIQYQRREIMITLSGNVQQRPTCSFYRAKVRQRKIKGQ